MILKQTWNKILPCLRESCCPGCDDVLPEASIQQTGNHRAQTTEVMWWQPLYAFRNELLNSTLHKAFQGMNITATVRTFGSVKWGASLLPVLPRHFWNHFLQTTLLRTPVFYVPSLPGLARVFFLNRRVDYKTVLLNTPWRLLIHPRSGSQSLPAST